MSSAASSSSESEGQYGNFLKYRKKHQLKNKRKAAEPPQAKTSPPKKFESQFSALKKIGTKKSSEEESETEMTIEQLIEQEKKKKKSSGKSVEIEILNDSVNQEEDEKDEAGPSNRTRSQQTEDAKKKNKKKDQYAGKAQAFLDEMKNLERQQKMEEKAHKDAVKYLANKTEAPVITVVDNDSVTILLGLLTDPDFRHIIKLKHTDRFDKIFLDYGSKAGFDKPEDITLLWDTGDEYKSIKYFDTPQKLGMPLRGTVKLSFNPKQGAQREKREDGEIKIKLNMKTQKAPLERFIHAEMPFGEFKIKLCAELKISPSKVRFTFDGEKVNNDSTPGDLDMEDFDCIDMHVDP